MVGVCCGLVDKWGLAYIWARLIVWVSTGSSFSCLPGCYTSVVSDRGNQSTQRKPPPNPKSLATNIHVDGFVILNQINKIWNCYHYLDLFLALFVFKPRNTWYRNKRIKSIEKNYKDFIVICTARGDLFICTFFFLFLSIRIPLRACEKVASALGLGGGFCQVLRFPQQITTG